MLSGQPQVQVTPGYLLTAANFWCHLSTEMSQLLPAIDQLGTDNPEIGPVATGPSDVLGIQEPLTALKQSYLAACGRMSTYCGQGATEWARICEALRAAHDKYVQTADAQAGVINSIPGH